MFVLTARQIAILSRLFSSSVVNGMAERGQSTLFKGLISEAGVFDALQKQVSSVGAVFDLIFGAINSPGRRNEYIYKSAIAHKRLLGAHSLNTAVMLEEFRAGSSKADVVILNGTSTVYEIKSERDSMARLIGQLVDYQKVFSRVNVITSAEQVKDVLSIAPNSVGVMCLTKRYQISTIREARNTHELICPVSIMDALRRDEAIAILNNMGINKPEVPNTQVYKVMRSLFEKLDPVQVHDEMVSTLRVTRSQADLNDFIRGLPRSLQAAALSARMNLSEQLQITKAVNTPLDIAMDWR